MTREEREDGIEFFKKVVEKEVDGGKYSLLAIEALQSISALSADLKAVDRDSMDEKTLIGFNVAVALFNKHLGGGE